MKLNKKYRITVEDESSLQKKLNLSARLPVLIIIITICLFAALAVGMLIMIYTPLKNGLPGYLKESERTATEQQHLRLDSLAKVYEVNEVYINSILNALNPTENERELKNDTISRKPVALKLDSLLPLSPEENAFMEDIRERDKYNISYASPAAAQSMMFGSVSNAAVISEESKNKYQAELLIPIGEPIHTVAEGKVISMASSPRYSGAYEIIIQHPKGFLSKTGRLKNLMVKPGDHVWAGQIIASGTAKDGAKSNKIIFELWHDGDPLIPSQYLNGGEAQETR